MSITASAESKASADFDGNKAGGIEVWGYSEVDSQTSTQTTIRYIWGFDQDQTYSDSQNFDAWLDGDSVYSATLTNSKGPDSWQYYSTTRTYTRPLYGSAAGTHTGRAQINGIYNGPESDTGSNTFDTTVPAKAGTVLGPPSSLTASDMTSSTITYTWVDPVTSGVGPDETNMYIEVSTSAAFTAGTFAYYAWVGDVNTKTVTGLARATTYYARVKSLNSVGEGAWSATEAASTLATVPDPPAPPTLSAPTSTGFTVSFVPPSNGGSAITSYTIRVSDDNFVTSTDFAGVTTSPQVLTGLDPGVAYKAAVRAHNAIGIGGFSVDAGPISTFGGVKVWNGTAWVTGLVRVWNGSSWVVCVVRKWNGTSWIV